MPLSAGTRGWTPGKPTVFVGTPATDVYPVFSPDGRWIAYCSDELNGTYDVYVRPFPGPGGSWRISTEGGGVPQRREARGGSRPGPLDEDSALETGSHV